MGRRLSMLLCSCAPLLMAAPALAQEASPSPPAATADTENDIVVTARRSAENIQSVPVSITAFSGETLRENNVTTPEDLQINTPGVFLSGSGGRQNANFVIRGQSKALSGPSSPAVISYFAEVPNPVFGSFTPQFDLSSVQVLKGPQGILFGRNTTGGAVLFEPAAPTHELGGYAQASYGNYDNRELEAVLNLPVNDKIAVRLGGNVHKRDGYTRNLLQPDRALDNINDYTLRGSLLLEPFEGFSNRTIVDYTHSRTHGFGSVLVDVFPGSTLLSILGLQSGFLARLAQQQARGNYVIDQPRASFERNKRLGITNRTEWELGAVTLVNIFGYRSTKLAYTTDTGTGRVIADGTGAFPAGTPVDLIVASLNQSTHQYSDELQLRGSLADDKLNWLVGAFYLRANPSGPQSNLVGFAQVPGFETGRTAYNFITEDSKALFGHLTYDLSAVVDGLQFEGGVRYTKDKVRSCAGVGPSSAGDDVGPGECLTKLTNAAVTRAKSNATTWSVGLNWQATDSLFAYAVSRRGYRAGGVNSPVFSGRLIPFQTFDPETVTDAEVGIRTDLRVSDDVALRFNVSGFVGWYKNVQTALTGVQTAVGACKPGDPAPITPDGDCDPNNDPAGGTLLLNLGKSRVSGIDLDGLIRVGKSLTFNYGANFLSPKTTSYAAPAAIAAFVPENKIPFNFTVKKTFTAGMRYKLPVSDAIGEIVFNADYYWSDKLPFSGTFTPSYQLVNARLDWNGVAGSSLDASLFARNLFKENYFATGAAAGAFLGFQTAIAGAPRTYGVELRYRFGTR